MPSLRHHGGFHDLDQLLENLSRMPKEDALLKLNELISRKNLEGSAESIDMLCGFRALFSHNPQLAPKLEVHMVRKKIEEQLGKLSSINDNTFEQWAHEILDAILFSADRKSAISLVTNHITGKKLRRRPYYFELGLRVSVCNQLKFRRCENWLFL